MISDSSPPQWRGSPRWARSVPVLAVLVLHAVLLLAWMDSVAPHHRGAAQTERPAPLVVRNVVLLPAPPATPAPPEQEAPAPAPQPRPRLARATAQPTNNAAIHATSSAPLADAPEPAAPVATLNEPAASAPLSLTLPTARSATMQGRGALTEAQGSMRQLALNDPRSNQRIDPTQQLPEAVAAAGKGDCVKGEYLGAGMGILSAPFLAYAAAAGHCKPQR